VVDVTVIVGALGTRSGVNIVNHAVRAYARLAPTHVPPDWENVSKVAVGGANAVANRVENSTHGGGGPGLTTVDGAEHNVLAGTETATLFVHAGYEYRADVAGVARRRADGRTGHLHIAEEGAGVGDRLGGPGAAVIRVHNLQGAGP